MNSIVINDSYDLNLITQLSQANTVSLSKVKAALKGSKVVAVRAGFFLYSIDDPLNFNSSIDSVCLRIINSNGNSAYFGDLFKSSFSLPLGEGILVDSNSNFDISVSLKKDTGVALTLDTVLKVTWVFDVE